ncbi:MAG: sigma-70 family RNA polymerase sigma factor [Clostridia bacterium]|nr:sigma-70 family RNA polymerase sigma factor [Clostridia bacterium]
MTDKETVGLFLKRDESALEAARRSFGAYCISLAFNVTGDRRDAEECFADALNAAWNSIPPLEPNDLGAYVAKLTRNFALETLRRRRAKKRGGGEAPLPLDEAVCVASDSDPVDRAAASELASAINAYLALRPQYQRVIFTMRYFRCERVADIAAALHRSPGSVTAVLGKLKKGLEKYLKERGFEL